MKKDREKSFGLAGKERKEKQKLDATKNGKRILWFDEINIKDIPLVGGKNASLGEMYNNLKSKGISVPNGFAVTSFSYWEFLEKSGLKKKIKEAVRNLNINDIKELSITGVKIRKMILEATFPKEINLEIEKAYTELSNSQKVKN